MRLRAWVLPVVLVALPSTAASQNVLRAAVYASGFASPIAIVQDPTNRHIQLVVEQAGRIGVVQDGAVLGDFLDIRSVVGSGGERGLLGLALAPDYAGSGRFYVNFTNTAGDTVVARFVRSGNPLVADASSRVDLKWAPSASPAIDQPDANHNGGHLAFGDDGYLYIGMGDGGSGNDPDNYAQTPSTLLGKMLRIDVDVPVDDTAGYRVPTDNPFVSSGPPGTRPEIWSFGWRNPWRWSFDSASRGGTGALVAGDVGQGTWEEINYEPMGAGGRNYGWRNREGAHDNVTSIAPAFLPLTDPIGEYGRSDGSSITGGYVYRGSALGATFLGRYFFGDFIRGRVWSIALNIGPDGNATAVNRTEHTAELAAGAALGNISSFGLDASGDLFIVIYSGTILRVFNPAIPAAPTNLRVVGP